MKTSSTVESRVVDDQVAPTVHMAKLEASFTFRHHHITVVGAFGQTEPSHRERQHHVFGDLVWCSEIEPGDSEQGPCTRCRRRSTRCRNPQ